MFGVLMLTYIRHLNAACNHGEKGRPAANLGWVGWAGGVATVPPLFVVWCSLLSTLRRKGLIQVFMNAVLGQ